MQIEKAKMSLEKQPFEPSVLISDAIEMMQSQASAKGITLEFQFALSTDPFAQTISCQASGESLNSPTYASRPATNLTPSLRVCPSESSFEGFLSGDRQRLTQVVLNLISNAIKFSVDGMTIRVRATVEPASEFTANLRFSVQDEGVGMTEEERRRLFGRFSQPVPFTFPRPTQSSSTRPPAIGTGLGLSISKQLVELMGGHIRVASEKGKGSRFEVFIPLEIVKIDRTLDAPQSSSSCELLAQPHSSTKSMPNSLQTIQTPTPSVSSNSSLGSNRLPAPTAPPKKRMPRNRRQSLTGDFIHLPRPRRSSSAEALHPSQHQQKQDLGKIKSELLSSLKVLITDDNDIK
jgi:hypothetical protein